MGQFQPVAGPSQDEFDALSGQVTALNNKMPFPPYIAKGIMGTTEDFNNITTSGTYQSNGTGSNANAPISGDDNGDLVVFGEHGRKLQLWVSAYNNKMLIRQQKNSTWSAWDEIALNSKRQLTITAGAHTVIDENDSYICGKVMVINFKCHSTSDISSSETIAIIEKTTVFDCIVPLFIGGAWSVSGALYGYVTGKSVIAGSINNGQYVHVNFTTLLA